MARPRTLFLVEWEVARDFEHPHDRLQESRRYATAEGAARQVAAVRRIAATHGALHGVWQVNDLDWRPVEPDSLPLPEEAAAVDAQLRAGWASHPDARVRRLTSEGDQP